MTRLTTRLRMLAIILMTVALSACGGDDQPAPPGSVVLKVSVSATGEIAADGKHISLEKLSEKMAALKQKGGAVFFHRENTSTGQHPNATKVIELVVQHKLPIRMSAKADFSDAAAAQSQPVKGN